MAGVAARVVDVDEALADRGDPVVFVAPAG
jgi:hypothetical protein